MARPRKHFSDKKLNPAKKALYNEFIRFTAYPSILRDKEFGFDTDGGFAKYHHISKDTVSLWKGREQFWDAVAVQLKVWGRGKTADVLMGLYRTAVRYGKAAESKLWLQYFEDYKEKGETTIGLDRESLKSIQDDMRALVKQETKKTIKPEPEAEAAVKDQ